MHHIFAIRWLMKPFEYNAYFDNMEGKMVFLAGYMQNNVYGIRRPRLKFSKIMIFQYSIYYQLYIYIYIYLYIYIYIYLYIYIYIYIYL